MIPFIKLHKVSMNRAIAFVGVAGCGMFILSLITVTRLSLLDYCGLITPREVKVMDARL